jgi:hypothetical protein
MPLNRWIEHIRKFARENNMTYSCALSDPNLKDGYIPAPKRMGKRARESLEMGAEDINRAEAKKAPAKKAPAKRMKRVIDIVGRKDSETGRVYYYNRFHDKSEAYGIVNNKVMIIGEVIEDYDDVNFFDDPKPVASNVRFYNSDKKPYPPSLNNLQEGLPAKAPSSAKKAPSPAKKAPSPAPATAPSPAEAKAEAQALYVEYARLHRQKWTNKIQKQLEIVEPKLNKITQPILKKELEQNYFTDEDGKKIRFKLILPEKRRFGKSPLHLSFTDEDGNVIKDLTENGEENTHTNPYEELLKAIKRRFQYRLFNRTAGLKDVTDLEKLLPNLLTKEQKEEMPDIYGRFSKTGAGMGMRGGADVGYTTPPNEPANPLPIHLRNAIVNATRRPPNAQRVINFINLIAPIQDVRNRYLDAIDDGHSYNAQQIVSLRRRFNAYMNTPNPEDEGWTDDEASVEGGARTDEGMDIYGRGRYRDIDYSRTIPHHKILEMCDVF